MTYAYIVHNQNAGKETFMELERQAWFHYKQDKRKYMMDTWTRSNGINALDIGDYSFEQLDTLICLGSLLNENSLDNDKIKSMTAKENTIYFAIKTKTLLYFLRSYVIILNNKSTEV